MFTFILRKYFPRLKKELRIAHVKDEPSMFVRKIAMTSVYLSLGITAMLFFLIGKSKIPVYALIFLFPLVYTLSFIFMMQTPKVIIRKRQKEIDREILFAGRYLLVKIESGVPLFNALTDASRSYGVMAKYFKEIVDDIRAGTPIEDALENAREYSASVRYKKILSELVTSLKTGVDVGMSLKALLKGISNDQLIEIKEYSKKLNAYVMLYMVLAVVVPSLGMTMLVVVAAFLSLQLSLIFIIIAASVLAFIQMVFIVMFRAIRPVVHL